MNIAFDRLQNNLFMVLKENKLNPTGIISANYFMAPDDQITNCDMCNKNKSRIITIIQLLIH